MKKFVVGFAYAGWSVLLQRKLRPDWQKGQLNGIGGKIEEHESPIAAMRREAQEEAGLGGLEWRCFAHLTGTNEGGGEVDIHCFHAECERTDVVQTGDEQLHFVDMGDLIKRPLTKHTFWLAPMGFQSERVFATVKI